MVRLRFRQGGEVTEYDGEAGHTLLDAAQAAGMPLEGTCEGQMACSTCHVHVARQWFAQLAVASEEEEDLLDLAAQVGPTSRLACQIVLGEALDGLEVAIPDESQDMRAV